MYIDIHSFHRKRERECYARIYPPCSPLEKTSPESADVCNLCCTADLLLCSSFHNFADTPTNNAPCRAGMLKLSFGPRVPPALLRSAGSTCVATLPAPLALSQNSTCMWPPRSVLTRGWIFASTLPRLHARSLSTSRRRCRAARLSALQAARPTSQACPCSFLASPSSRRAAYSSSSKRSSVTPSASKPVHAAPIGSWWHRLRSDFKQHKTQFLATYGLSAFLVHEALGISSYLIAFALLYSGMVGKGWLEEGIARLGWTQEDLARRKIDLDSPWVTFAMTYPLVKCADMMGLVPLRWCLTFLLTPPVSRVIGPSLAKISERIRRVRLRNQPPPSSAQR
eukprot:g82304.t1